MGLDSVEILMKVEKTFGINIPDQEAEKIITVGDFHNSVWQHLEGKYTDKCKSQGLFYSLRKSVIDTFEVSKQEYKLNRRINDIFPSKQRRQVYFRFANANNLKLPGLVLTKPWSIFLTSFGFITILGGLSLSIILINFFDYSNWTILIPLASIILTYFVSNVLQPKRTVIEQTSVREFTEKVLALNYATLSQANGNNRKEVESVINNIIADMAGLELNEVTPEKKISDDLGID